MIALLFAVGLLGAPASAAGGGAGPAGTFLEESKLVALPLTPCASNDVAYGGGDYWFVSASPPDTLPHQIAGGQRLAAVRGLHFGFLSVTGDVVFGDVGPRPLVPCRCPRVKGATLVHFFVAPTAPDPLPSDPP